MAIIARRWLASARACVWVSDVTRRGPFIGDAAEVCFRGEVVRRRSDLAGNGEVRKMPWMAIPCITVYNGIELVELLDLGKRRGRAAERRGGDCRHFTAAMWPCVPFCLQH